ncbi:SH3 domain-binding glutamic acid-rich-like protein 2 [Geospiza fortis]|uniref:SH3 domain-binding glutamic acid-rich-like protein 2 n=1 Tax=Geospiza fortis TaxID=48883 RepID=A0A6I9Z9J0_GEOFO|nr:SH3 domain-binding glutamic acid-rich-like protein 2 [Geospiza fortis]
MDVVVDCFSEGLAEDPSRKGLAGMIAYPERLIFHPFAAVSGDQEARPGPSRSDLAAPHGIKKRQQDVVRFLEANRIEFEEVDITMSEEKRQWMYKNIPEDRQPAQGNPLPPQIFSDDRYCGDYDGFFESKESNTVFSFLGLKPTLASKESEP